MIDNNYNKCFSFPCQAVPKRIFAFWLGNNSMSPARAAALQMMRENLTAPLEFVTSEDLYKWIIPDDPLPQAFKFLTATHQADYLRAYFLYHHGGGYTDVKPYQKDNNWGQMLDYINANPQIEVLGFYNTKNQTTLDVVPKEEAPKMLLQCAYFMARPHSQFTFDFYNRVKGYVISKAPELRKSKKIDERSGGKDYPIPYLYVMGFNFFSTLKEHYETRPQVISGGLKFGTWDRKNYR